MVDPNRAQRRAQKFRPKMVAELAGGTYIAPQPMPDEPPVQQVPHIPRFCVTCSCGWQSNSYPLELAALERKPLEEWQEHLEAQHA